MIEAEENKKIKKYPALFGLGYRYQRSDDSWAFGINYFRVSTLVLSLVVLLWVFTSLGIYAFMKYRRGFDEMTFKDACIMPFDRSDIDRRHGDASIELAEEALDEGDIKKAFGYLNSGTQKSVENIKGKKLLAEMELRFYNRADFALRTMELGVPFALQDLDYMRFYYSLLLREFKDKRLLAVGEKVLASEEAGEDVKIFTAMTMATVYSMHAQFDNSKEMMQKYNIDKTLVGVLRLSRNEWEKGNKQEAIQIAGTALSNLGNTNPEPIYALLVEYYREMGDYNMARIYAVLRRSSSPLSIEAHLSYIEILQKEGGAFSIDNDMQLVYDLVKSDPKQLMLLATYAATNNNVELMEKVYSIAVEKNFYLPVFSMLRIDALLVAKDYEKAVTCLDLIYKENPVWLKRFRGYFDCLYCAAYAGVDNDLNAKLKLDAVMASNLIPAKNLLGTVRRLDEIGYTDLAYKLLLHLNYKNPNYQLALARLIEIEIKMGNSTNLEKRIMEILQTRRPPRSILASIRESLYSDKFIFVENRDVLFEEMDKFLSSKEERINPSEYDSTIIEDDDRIININ